MTVKWHTLLKPLALGLGLALALLWLLGSSAPPARAAGPTCTVCAGGGCDYATIQAAVDHAGCTEIKVARGVYSGVQARPIPSGYPDYEKPESNLITQVVYISRTVTVRGGYTTTNWTTPDPVAQPTTLDAGGLGRALVVAGAISPMIDGLGLTGGNAAGLGGLDYRPDGGGGMYVINATATIRACRVFSNTAANGGGLVLHYSPATLDANSITSNIATDGEGGGLYLYESPATLSANSIASNTATGSGGGVSGWKSSVLLSANSVTSNTSGVNGGGVHLWQSDNVRLSANSVTSNTADFGGGVYLDLCNGTLNANNVAGNTVTSFGGGMYLAYSPATLNANSLTGNTATYGGGGLFTYESPATLVNTVVADNQTGGNGGGLHLYGFFPDSPRLLHTTIARNGGNSGVYVDVGGTLWLTNTILVSHTLGITVSGYCAAVLSNTLWYGNDTAMAGAGPITHTGDYSGDPAFVDPAGGDYHIGSTSAAISQGVAAGVALDKDRHPRSSTQPDLGAYEFGPVYYGHLPVIMKTAR